MTPTDRSKSPPEALGRGWRGHLSPPGLFGPWTLPGATSIGLVLAACGGSPFAAAELAATLDGAPADDAPAASEDAGQPDPPDALEQAQDAHADLAVHEGGPNESSAPVPDAAPIEAGDAGPDGAAPKLCCVVAASAFCPGMSAICPAIPNLAVGCGCVTAGTTSDYHACTAADLSTQCIGPGPCAGIPGNLQVCP